MSELFGDDTLLFRKYVAGKRKRVLPWQLSIIDCFLIFNALRSHVTATEPLMMSRISDGGEQVESVKISDAYDLYEIDRDADGYEVVLLHRPTGFACYWDLHERFVALTGSDELLTSAYPVPDDIEVHRFIEGMTCSEQIEQHGGAELIYRLVKAA